MEAEDGPDAPLLPRGPRTSHKKARPSAVKCGCVLCGLIIAAAVVFIIGSIIYGAYKGFESIRYPHKQLYLNSTHSGPEHGIRPFIDKDTKFDVYFSIHVRLPDAEQVRDEVREEEERQRLGHTLQVLKTQTMLEDMELLRMPQEECVWSGKVIEGADMKTWNEHRDIEFELPLRRL